MTDMERLAVEQAIFSAIAADVRTGDPDNLRGRVNEHFLDLYEQTGATGFEYRLYGTKVGTYGFNKVKAQPERRELAVIVSDRAELEACDDDEWLDWCSRWMDEHLEQLAVEYVKETGVMLPGTATMERVTPAKPEGIRPGGTLRLDPKRVAEVMGPALGDAVRGLLGGGDDA